MATERFAWRSVEKLTGALELRKRNISRCITKDAKVPCWICGKKPVKGDTVYYPAERLALSNTVIAHKNETDRFCEENTAKRKGVATVAAHSVETVKADAGRIPRRGERLLETHVSDAHDLPPVTEQEHVTAVDAALRKAVTELRSQIRKEVIAEVLADLPRILDELNREARR